MVAKGHRQGTAAAEQLCGRSVGWRQQPAEAAAFVVGMMGHDGRPGRAQVLSITTTRDTKGT